MANVNSSKSIGVEDSKSPKKMAVVSCEVVESVNSPQHENALGAMPEKGVQEHARSETTVVKDRYQANVRQPLPIMAP